MRGFARAAVCGQRFLADEKGATAIEYGLLVGGIGFVLCVTLFAVGASIKDVLYEKIAAALAAMS